MRKANSFEYSDSEPEVSFEDDEPQKLKKMGKLVVKTMKEKDYVKKQRRKRRQSPKKGECRQKKPPIFKEFPESVVEQSLTKCLQQPLYSPLNKSYELDYLVGLALEDLENSSVPHLHVISRHLSGLQPDLKTPQLAKSILNFFIRKEMKQWALERPLIALVRLLDGSSWPKLEAAIVDLVPDSLTAPNGPPASDSDALGLGRLAAWLCLLRRERSRLLGFFAEMLGRRGPKVVPACLGALLVWPAIIGTDVLSRCITMRLHTITESKYEDYSKKLYEWLQGHPLFPPQTEEAFLEDLMAEKNMPSQQMWYSIILLVRTHDPDWIIQNLIKPILLPLACKEDEVAAAPAVVMMGLIGRYLLMGKGEGRIAGRRSLILAILDIRRDNSTEVLNEAVATALVAAVGAGKPIQLRKALSYIHLADVSEAFKVRLTAWSTTNLQPLFHRRKRTRKNEMSTDSVEKQLMYEDLQFPETVKELFNFDTPESFSDSDLRGGSLDSAPL